MLKEIFFVLFIAANCSATSVQPTLKNEIMMTFFFGHTNSFQYSVHNFHEIFSHPAFIRSRGTVVYHYGWSQTVNTENVVDVVDAYRTTDDVNFILIHYDGITINVSNNARVLSEAIAAALVRLFDQGYSSHQTHLVGFSLGATVMSLTARSIRSTSHNRHEIGRVTGLDPGQLGAQEAVLGRLSPSDAFYVDSIHTESTGFGDFYARGHSSFFPNGGISQPFCNQAIEGSRQVCSHNFAVFAWAESVRARSAIFPSLPCPLWEDFAAGRCNSNTPIGNMGSVSQTYLRGTFFLSTNMQAPWSRNVATP